MPEFVSCPKCGFRVQMLLAMPGKRVRCANCGGSFEPGTAADPAPVEKLPPLEAMPTEDTQRRPPPRREEPPPIPRRRDEWRAPRDTDLPWRPPRIDAPYHLRPLFDEDEYDLPFCPGCGRRVRWEVVACPRCHEEFDDDRDLRPTKRRPIGVPRGDGEDDEPRAMRGGRAHRAALIGGLGNVSMVLGLVSMCVPIVPALISVILGIVAWVMASSDLIQMREGAMDVRGRRATEAGRNNAIIGIVCGGVFAGGWIFFFLLIQ
jgi:hypothetical protein